MYWLVALPLEDNESPDHVWNKLQELTVYRNDYSINYKFKLPENLRIGTLDSLLALSDDLIKVNSAVEGTVNKLRRQLYDLQSGLAEEEREEAWVEGVSPETYIQRFTWNEAKYPSRRPPKETIQSIMETVQKLDEDLKSRSTDYSVARTALQALLRKHTGSLAVRDLSDLVPKDVLVSTENLTTLVTVVPKASRADYLACYESLTDLIVPRSSVQIAEDNDYVAYAVVLFRRVVDEFKASARAKGFQAKDVAGASLEAFALTQEKVLDGGSGEEVNNGTHGFRPDGGDELTKLKEDAEVKRAALVQWCLVSYGEAFSSWIHVTAIRLFVESILRYGLPPQFLPVLVHPYSRHQTTVRKLLATHFGGIGGHHFTLEGGGGGGTNEELFPYVSFTLNVEE